MSCIPYTCVGEGNTVMYAGMMSLDLGDLQPRLPLPHKQQAISGTSHKVVRLRADTTVAKTPSVSQSERRNPLNTR